jgi:hypothetical protein
MLVLVNHCELQIESKSIKASCIWFYVSIDPRPYRSAPRSNSGRRTDDTHRILVFDQTLVVTAQGYQEQDGRDVFKARYPLRRDGRDYQQSGLSDSL